MLRDHVWPPSELARRTPGPGTPKPCCSDRLTNGCEASGTATDIGPAASTFDGTRSAAELHVRPPSVVRQSAKAWRSVPVSPTTSPFAGSRKLTARTSAAARPDGVAARQLEPASLVRASSEPVSAYPTPPGSS